jgi:excisionase family DNA binding protein
VTQTPPPRPTPWMTRAEVAEYLRCSKTAVDKLARAKLLTRYRPKEMPQHVLYHRSEVAGIVIVADLHEPVEEVDA